MRNRVYQAQQVDGESIMKRITLLAVLIVSLSFIGFGCQTQDQASEEGVAERQREGAVQETREATQEAQQAVTASTTEFKQEVETKLNKLEKDIDQLEAKAGDMTAESRGEFNKMMNELNEKQAEAQAKLSQLESASADTWEDAKSGITEAVNDLQTTYDQATSRFQ
jgi:ribosome-associated translation inhibitor RaiA